MVVQEWCDRGFSTASTCLRVKYERATGRSERSEWSEGRQYSRMTERSGL
jgi:hypothetical protein